jgi:hypothetical protein
MCRQDQRRLGFLRRRTLLLSALPACPVALAVLTAFRDVSTIPRAVPIPGIRPRADMTVPVASLTTLERLLPMRLFFLRRVIRMKGLLLSLFREPPELIIARWSRRAAQQQGSGGHKGLPYRLGTGDGHGTPCPCGEPNRSMLLQRGMPRIRCLAWLDPIA